MNASPVLLGPAVALEDIGTTWYGGTLRVTGVLAEDRIGIASGGDVTRAGNTISYQGIPIGAVGTAAGETGLGESLLVTFNAAATADSVQAATRALTYQNVSDAPTSQRRLTVVLTDGVGTQTAPGRGGQGFTQYTGAASPFDAIAVATHADPTFGDLDGDGDLDMVTGDDAGAVRYFRNDGTTMSPAYVELAGAANPFDGLSVAPSTAPELVDLDGDGLLDLVTGGTNGEPQLRLFRNTGTSTAPAFSQVTGSGDPFSGITTDYGDMVRVAFGDLDGDGDMDMVAGVNGALTYYRNDGNAATPSFTAVTGAGSPLDGVVLPSAGALTPALGDVDGDGDLDLAVGHNNNGQVSYLLNTGTAGSPAFALQSGVDNPFGDVTLANGGSHLSLADLDGDGRLDLAIGDVAGEISYFSRTQYTLMVSVAAQDEPPVLAGGGGSPTAQAGGAGVAVDPNLTISGGEPGGTISRASVVIGAGFAPTEDVLLFDDQDGITGGYDAATGVLTLTGTASLADYQAALRTVRYRNTNGDSTTASRSPRTISFSLAPGVYNPANGHFYEFVSAPGISWTAARDAAAARDVFGVRGYLATITTADENAFAFGKTAANGWLGGSDAAEEGVWRWVTGPEAGVQFWDVPSGGTPVNGLFSNWDAGEPAYPSSDGYLLLLFQGVWHDAPDVFANHPGYFVEYGGMPGDPVLSLTSTTTVGVYVVTDVPTVAGPTSASVVYTSPYSVRGTAESGSLVRVYVDVNGDGQIDEGDALVGSQQLGGGETQFSVGVTLAELAPTRILVTAQVADADESAPVALPALTYVAPPVLTGGMAESEALTGGVGVVVDPNLTIAYNGPSISAASVAIGAGFVPSEDRLLFDAQDGITGSYDPTTGILSLTGTATPAQYQAALRSVRYQNINADPVTADRNPRSVTFSLAPGAYNPTNGHYYEFVQAPGILWTAAREQALDRTIFGMQGYLATITDLDENVFAFSKARANGWVGGSDAAQEGVWRWIDGPEAGLQFSDWGASVDGSFVSWNPGQPDNAGAFEHYMQFVLSGNWNDLPNDSWGGIIAGYVVEYGGMPGDPALTLVSTITVNVASVSAPPTVTSPDAAVVTNETTVAVVGTADAGALVRVYVDANGDGLLDEGDTVVGSQQLGVGETEFSISVPLAPNSVNRLLVTGSLAGFPESDPTAVPPITSDRLAPAVPTVTVPAGPVVVNAPTAAISGTAEAGSNVMIYRDVNGDGVLDEGDALIDSQQLASGETSYAFDVALTQDAANRFLVVAVDAAGNRSAAAAVPTIVEDSTAPAAPTVLAPTGAILVNGYAATLPGTAEAGSLVEVFDDANGNGQLDEGEQVVGSQQLGAGQTRYDVPVPLTLNAANRFIVRSTDAAGNRSPVAVVPTILQDALSPAAPTLAGPAAPVSLPAASYNLSGAAEAGSLVRVYVDANGNGRLDPGEQVVGSQQLGQGASAYSITVPLAPGAANRFLVTSTDAAGNQSETRSVPTITQDSTPPAAPIPTAPIGPVSVGSPSITLTGTAEAGSLVEVFDDANGNGALDEGEAVVGSQALGGSAAASAAYAVTVPLRANSANRFIVRSTDAAGNRSAAVALPVVSQDSVAPAAPTLAGPTAPVSTAAASYNLSGAAEAGSLVRVYVDANGNGLVDPGEQVVGSQQLGQGASAYSITVPLAPGAANRFLVTSTDAAGNRSAAVAAAAVMQDSTPPAAPSPGSTAGSISADGTTATLTGVAEAGSLVQIYADVNRNGVMDFGDAVVGYQQLAPGQTGYRITVPLSSGGAGNFLVVSVDAAGNASTAVAVAVSGDAVAPSVVSVQRFGYHWEPTRIVVGFSEPVDAAAAQDASAYRLVGPRGGAIRIASVRYDAATNSVTISPASRLYLYQSYRLSIAPRAMVDAAGNRPGVDHVAQISRANLVAARPLRPASARLAAVDAVLSAGVRIRRGR